MVEGLKLTRLQWDILCSDRKVVCLIIVDEESPHGVLDPLFVEM
jgi:hypothetical protein